VISQKCLVGCGSAAAFLNFFKDKIMIRKSCAIVLSSSLTLLFSLVTAQPAKAMDTFFVGPRAMAMSGAVVAAPTDTSAQYYNPAAFGFFAKGEPNVPGEVDATGEEDVAGEVAVAEQPDFDNNGMGRKKYGLDVNAGVGYRLHNNFGQYLDQLADVDLDRLADNGINSESDLRDLTDLVIGLEGLDSPGNAITADANGSLGLRVGHFGVGAFSSFQATARVLNVDTTNLGLTINAADFATEVNSVDLSGSGYVGDGAYTVFTPTQQAQMLMALGGDTVANRETLDRLDYMVAQESVSAADIQGVADIFATVITDSASATTDLQNNTSTILLNGFGLVEVPITYGYALNDNLSVGGNLKLMKGRVYGNEVVVFDDDADDVLDQTDEYYQETTTLGLDLGVMYRIAKFNFGLVGRNLNSPKFDGPTINRIGGGTLKIDDVRVDPQFAVGAAWIPFKTLAIEADLDLTENETTLLDYSTRNLGIGLEWDAFRFLALRLGAHKNLSESDIGWVYSGGFGLNLWLIRLDVAGAFSADKERFDDEDIPKETRVSAQLSFDF
jgi:hypothetical protein